PLLLPCRASYTVEYRVIAKDDPRGPRGGNGMVRPVRAPHVLPRSRLLLALCAVAVAAGVLGGVADTQGAAQRPDLRIRLQFARPGGIYDPAYWRYTSDGWVYPALFNQLVR